MYGVLQTAFRPSCMNWASVFEWHKRFKEGRESVRDDERCGRSKEVRTPELIGQIKNFMDKDRRMSISTISALFDVRIATVHKNYSRRTEDAEELREGCSEKIRKKDVVMTAGIWSSWSIQIPQFLMLWCPAMKAGSTAMTQRPRDWVPSRSMLALPDQRRPDRAKSTHKLLMIPFWQHWHDLHALGSFWTDSQLGIICWGFKGVRKEIASEEVSTIGVSGISTGIMHKSTTPSLSQTIWARWASRQFLTSL